MQRIVIGMDHSGFALSHEALLWLREHGDAEALAEPFQPMDKDGVDRRRYWIFDDRRDHLLLIQCLEELGDKAAAGLVTLQIVDIPDDIQWFVTDDEGCEYIEEEHRRWHGDWDRAFGVKLNQTAGE